MQQSVRQRLSTWLSQKPFLRSVSILAGGTAASQALGLLAMPIVTRLYPLAAFGYFQVYMSILTAALTVAALRYEMALLLPPDEDTACNLRSVSLACVGVVSATLAIVVAGLKFSGMADRMIGKSAPWLWWIPAGIFAAGLLQVETSWALRNRSFRHVAQSKFTQISSQLATQIGVGTVAPVGGGLMGGDVVGRLFSTLVLLATGWKRSAAAFRIATWKGMIAAAKRYKEFPLVSSFSGLLNTAGFALPPLFIGYFYGVNILGLFSVVDRVMGAPVLLVGQAVSQVFMAEGGRLAATSPQGLETLFSRTFRRLLQMAVIPALLIVVFAPAAFSFGLGPQWREAGIYAQLLVGRQVIAFAIWPLSQTLSLLERQRLQLAWDAGRAGLNLGTIAACAWLGCSARTTIFWYGVTMVLGYFVYWLMCRSILCERARQHVASTALADVPLREMAHGGVR